VPPSSRALDCAALLAEAAPALVDVIREEGRRQRNDLSVGQLRAISYLSRHGDASLSDLAAVVGLTLPATSRLVDGLVERRLVSRAAATDDRRKVTLHATPAGRAVLRSVRESAHGRLAALLEGFPASDLDALSRVLAALQQRLPGGSLQEAPA